MNFQPISVVVAGPCAVLANSLRMNFSDIAVVAETEHWEQAFERIMKMQPDVTLLDAKINGCDAMQLIRYLRRFGSKTGILLLVPTEDASLIRDALESGANSYILKSATDEEIVEAIRDVYEASQILVQLPLLSAHK